MSTPFFDLIEELRSLGGAPKVTYPTGSNSYPQTERTIKAKRGTHILALGSAEPDTVRFPNNILTEQVELRSDAQIVEVYRKYEVLPGPFTMQGQEYDPEYGFLAEYTEGEVKNGAAIGTALSDIEPENYIKSNLKTYTIPTAALNAFYLTFPAKENIELPRVLSGVNIVWDTTVGSGSFEENGTGSAAGTAVNLNLAATGRGQGSASVLADISPIFAPEPPANLPVIDYFFFLPNPVSEAQILTRASAIATALAGTATVVNDWPLFRPVVHTIILTGQKVSVSCEAAARVAISVSPSGASDGASTGTGTSQDFGSTVRAVTLPACIHGAITFTGAATNSSASSASAYAYEAIGSYTAGSTTPTTLSTSASGAVTPASLAATPMAAYPASGLYLYKPDVSPYKWGYSAVRARIFDFSVLGLPQITLVDFAGQTGANFVTGSAGFAFVLPSLSGGIYGVWFQTGTESQPDLSGQSVTTYVGVTVPIGDTAAQIAAALVTSFVGSIIWTVAIDPNSSTGVLFTAMQNGLTAAATDINTGSDVDPIQFGAP